MLRLSVFSVLAASALSPLVSAASSQSYTWNNVKIGGGGGFVPSIVFNPSQKGLAFARTDIGGAYKLNADDSWTPLLDFADDARWNYWGVDALATDPVDPKRLYLATGMYTNSWDPNNGQILISKDTGATWTASKLPFKVGGNMPGRGMGERLAVDPNSNNILFYGARSGNGLLKSTDYGATWTKVSGLTNVGTYVPDASDTSGYNSDKIGVSFVTFDQTSGSSGTATPRIFVGVASTGTPNLFMSNDGGSTFSAITGTNTTWMPHKGVLSPAEKSLYISAADGAGPYDGTLGAVYKYNITSGVVTNITPVSGGDLYFGFGGLSVDLQKPGTVMVAALNEWYPDANIFRSTDGGATWSKLWEWQSYPTINRYMTYSNALAPWLGVGTTSTSADIKQIGWMIEGLSIDPFDSNHWLYGTGATIYGGHDLLKWDSVHNVSISSLADGIEETSIQNLISPPSGPVLISAVGDITGFVHDDLTKAPSTGFTNPAWPSTADLDYAGNKPTYIVRIGTGDSSTGKQVAYSSDSGKSWNQHYGAADNVQGGRVAVSADADTILWRTNGNGVQVSSNQATFSAVSSLPSDAAIASDKKTNAIFYGSSAGKFYISKDIGKTFTATAGSLGASTSAARVIVHPSVSGDVWVSTDKGLFHTTDSGATFTAVKSVTQAWAIALGAPKTTGGYPALYTSAIVDGVTGVFRSDDAGVNWVQINDAAHGFGAASANPIAADLRTYGRVFVGTNGRGIFVGTASGSAPQPTATATSGAPSSTSVSTSKPVSSSTIVSTTTSKPVSSTTTSKPASSTTTSKPVSTTSAPITSAPNTTKTSTAPSSTATGTVQKYGQCGGTGYSGPTVCVTGTTCTKQNDYYWQCL